MNGKLKAFLLLGVMFALGAASGIAWQTMRNQHDGFMRHAIYTEHRIKRLKSQLKLSPVQEQALRDIFQKANERASQINEEVSWDLADIHRESVQAIRQVLTPDQAREFEKLHRKFHRSHPHVPDDSDEPEAPAKATS